MLGGGELFLRAADLGKVLKGARNLDHFAELTRVAIFALGHTQGVDQTPFALGGDEE